MRLKLDGYKVIWEAGLQLNSLTCFKQPETKLHSYWVLGLQLMAKMLLCDIQMKWCYMIVLSFDSAPWLEHSTFLPDATVINLGISNVAKNQFI